MHGEFLALTAIIALFIVPAGGAAAFWLVKKIQNKKKKPELKVIEDRKVKIQTTTKDDITFALRGDLDATTLAARYSLESAEPILRTAFGTGSEVQRIADATSINGATVLSFDTGAQVVKAIGYRAGNAVPATRTWSVLVRVKFSTVGNNPLFSIGFYGRQYSGGINISLNSATQVGLTVCPESDAPGNDTLTVSTISTGTWYDLVFTYDNTQSPLSRTWEVFVDGVSQGTVSSARDLPDTSTEVARKAIAMIVMGDNPIYADKAMRAVIDEVIVTDTIIDPTDVMLTSGAGSLNGASRTAYVDVDAFDGVAASGGGRIIKVI